MNNIMNNIMTYMNKPRDVASRATDRIYDYLKKWQDIQTDGKAFVPAYVWVSIHGIIQDEIRREEILQNEIKAREENA